MQADYKRILILCKTYPSPSSRYVETSCVAGMDESGRFIRLFPVPFRLITDEQQFKKWQWIRARVRKAPEDHRTESYRISVDTIESEEWLSTKNFWHARRLAMELVESFNDFDSLQLARVNRGVTLGLLKPFRLKDLKITKASSSEWTADEVAKLMQAQNQASIFDQLNEDQRALKLLKKLPFDFHYEYECLVDGVVKTYKNKLVDWEAGALYWNVCHRADWQDAFKEKFLEEFSKRDVQFLMGTIHRFPDQWLIISVLYPPMPPATETDQGRLF